MSFTWNCLIENSKNIWGYAKIPFILWDIKKEYKILKRISFKLREGKEDTISYSKDFLRYKLGIKLIKVCDTWYKGDLIKFYFEAKKIKKEKNKTKS